MAGINSKALNFGSPQNRKKFNGIEETRDLDLNQYDAFYRNADPQIGRWLQIDPLSEKYYCLSPYLGMGDNPILTTDPLGDDLEFKGKSKNVDKAFDEINAIFDGFYIVSIGKDNKVKIDATEKKGEKSKQTEGLFEVMARVVNNKEGTVVIEVVNKKSKVDIDNWGSQKIDIADIKKFGTGKYTSSASVLAHAFAEQESLQIDNKDNPARGAAEYFRDHNKGKDAEGIVTGFSRSSTEFIRTRPNLLGNTTGTYSLFYYDATKYTLDKNNKKQFEFHRVDVKFRNGNIKSVKSY